MNTAPLKSYAPAARRAFIAAVTAQAARLGITAKGNLPATVQGDVLLVNGQPFPRSVESGRNKLIDRVKGPAFEATMEAVAYTWFNRLVAIRYMELHNYLDHGYRVLSDPGGSGRPEILDKATEVDLPGLVRAKVVQLKLDGTRDEELYRMLLIAQCNALHKAMPFLFEKIGDETELLLPANLLHTDSLIRQLVESIEESAWQQIEIIGWLYQFYISEKKDQVIGKVVKSEDIPAATQLFTPNWIVKYMVQNTLGAQWLATYPTSPLRAQMEYYIEPAEQTEEVKAQLAAITPASLNPEEITLIDPACGSGHILVEAYELFKAIYVERGYRERDAAQLILTKNLYGLDIDPRAAQLSGFALMMKGRSDDRRLFERDLQLNVMAMVNSDELNIAELIHEVKLADFGLQESDLRELKKLFEHATTFGSLIQVPEGLVAKLPGLRTMSQATESEQRGQAVDMFAAAALEFLAQLVRQAEVLAGTYDNVVANPPYLGSKGMNDLVKKFVKGFFQDTKSDIFACFVERGRRLGKSNALIAIVAPYVWMFLSSYEKLRTKLIERSTLESLIQLEYNAFEPACVPVATFIVRKHHVMGRTGSYIKLSDFKGHLNQAPRTLQAIRNPDCGWLYRTRPDDLRKIPGSPIAFGMSEAVLKVFEKNHTLAQISDHAHGMSTGNNERFVRRWTEVSQQHINYNCRSLSDSKLYGKWFPFNKGGSFRRWYGNNELLVNFKNEGREMRDSWRTGETPGFRCDGSDFFFQPGITWSSITSSSASFRSLPEGFVICNKGQTLYPCDSSKRNQCLGLLNSRIVDYFLSILSPTLGYELGYVKQVPVVHLNEVPGGHVESMIAYSRTDWDSYERSWDFSQLPIFSDICGTLKASYIKWVAKISIVVQTMKQLEEENNRIFISAYGLHGELTPEVPIEQVTLTVNPAYRYGIKGTEEERQTRFREDTMQELVSYAVGCMMGRYSLDEHGLIYAHSGNEGFDSSRYSKFPADDDGIIPVTDSAWFEDDAATRLEEFLSVAWDKAHLEENLTFLADNLSPNKNETSRDTIRRYLCDKFYKDHLQTYKNRPIYWLFSSGKQKAFQCLVYLHRYNNGTLARMRSEYVIPLQGKMAARLAHLADDRVSASAAQQKRIDKETSKLKKQHDELLEFDEKLRHYADRRISLDLDDGVKVNYGKFGSLLVEVATVHGQKAEGP